MKIACAKALAALAREDVPDEVAAAYHGQQLKFGRQYIIPTPFDPRLIHYIPPFVAQAAMDSGVARQADRGYGRLSREPGADGSIPPRASCRRSPARCSPAHGVASSSPRARTRR